MSIKSAIIGLLASSGVESHFAKVDTTVDLSPSCREGFNIKSRGRRCHENPIAACCYTDDRHKINSKVTSEHKEIFFYNTSSNDVACFIEQLPKRCAKKITRFLGSQGSQYFDIPNNIHKLSRLKEIFIEHLPVRSIPRSIGKLKHLEKLIILKPTLIRYPYEALGNLTKLQKFYLGNKQYIDDIVYGSSYSGPFFPTHVKELTHLEKYINVKKETINLSKTVRKLEKKLRKATTKSTQKTSQYQKELESIKTNQKALQKANIALKSELQELQAQYELQKISFERSKQEEVQKSADELKSMQTIVAKKEQTHTLKMQIYEEKIQELEKTNAHLNTMINLLSAALTTAFFAIYVAVNKNSI